MSRGYVGLPSGWKEIQLGKVAQLSGRIGWKGLTAKEYTREGPLFLSVHSLNYGDYVNFRDAFHISRQRYDESPEIMLRPNDVLICKDGAGIGKIGIVGELPGETTINSSLLLVRAQASILPKYLYYILSSPYFQKIVKSRLMGATTPHLYQRDIAEFPIYLPPLPEQQRIVAILDEAIAGLATATANAEKNLKKARELFDNYLTSVFHDDEGWEEATLGSIAEFKNGLNFTKSSKGDEVRIVGVKDFQSNFWVPFDDLESARVDGGLSNSYLLQKGDILTVRSNGNKQLIGRCMLAADVPERTSHSGFTIRIRITKSDVNPDYLVRYLKSGAVRKSLIESGDGAQISNLNQQALTALPVKLATLAKQQEIVERLRDIEAEAGRLEASYQRRIASLAELKRSILQKAFSGELTSAARGVVVPRTTRLIDRRRDTALVIALAYERHKRHNRSKSLGHTKEQKILHMVEAEAEFDLGRRPIRDAAGPNDFHHMLAAEEWAEANRYFRVSERATGGYEFQPLAQFHELLNFTNSIEPTIRTKIERIIDVFIPMDMTQAEVFATVYAAWNNLLIEGKTPTDDEILWASREDWHRKKLEIPRKKFVEGLHQVRRSNLKPLGKGRFVPPAAQGQLPL